MEHNNSKRPLFTPSSFLPSKKTRNDLCCSFCGFSEHETKDEGPLTKHREELYIHEICLLFSRNASRKQSDSSLISKVMSGSKKYLCAKKECISKERSCASIECSAEVCTKLFHYRCALADGSFLPSGHLLCGDHRNLAPAFTSDAKKILNWPSKHVRYIYENDWSNISEEDKELVARSSKGWDTWADIDCRSVRILVVDRSHWAWTKDMPYDLVAGKNIKKRDPICEIVGVMRKISVDDVIPDHHTNVFIPQEGSEEMKMFTERYTKKLTIDSSKQGNEGRYVNFLPDNAQKLGLTTNANTRTLWSMNKLKVVVIAKRDIKKGDSIILEDIDINSNQIEDQLKTMNTDPRDPNPGYDDETYPTTTSTTTTTTTTINNNDTGMRDDEIETEPEYGFHGELYDKYDGDNSDDDNDIPANKDTPMRMFTSDDAEYSSDNNNNNNNNNSSGSSRTRSSTNPPPPPTPTIDRHTLMPITSLTRHASSASNNNDTPQHRATRKRDNASLGQHHNLSRLSPPNPPPNLPSNPPPNLPPNLPPSLEAIDRGITEIMQLFGVDIMAGAILDQSTPVGCLIKLNKLREQSMLALHQAEPEYQTMLAARKVREHLRRVIKEATTQEIGNHITQEFAAINVQLDQKAAESGMEELRERHNRICNTFKSGQKLYDALNG